MAKKIPEELTNELWKAINRLEHATEIIKSYVDYCDVNERELTESERIYLHRCKEFIGVK